MLPAFPNPSTDLTNLLPSYCGRLQGLDELKTKLGSVLYQLEQDYPTPAEDGAAEDEARMMGQGQGQPEGGYLDPVAYQQQQQWGATGMDPYGQQQGMGGGAHYGAGGW